MFRFVVTSTKGKTNNALAGFRFRFDAVRYAESVAEAGAGFEVSVTDTEVDERRRFPVYTVLPKAALGGA